MDKTYQQVLKKLHFDMHTPENITEIGKYLDVDKYVEAIKTSGAESVTLFARCAYGFTYFPTTIGTPHPNMERDVFGEICDGLRKESIDVTAYINLAFVPDIYTRKNGFDRVAHDEEGKPRGIRGTNDFHPGCITSDLLYGEILPLMVECAEKYDINAIWLDSLYEFFNHPCFCDRCRAEAEKVIPNFDGDMQSRPVYAWWQKIVWQFLNDAAIAVAKVKPNCTIGSDVIGCLMWSKPHPKEVKFVTYDPQTPNLPVNISLHMASTAWRGVTADMNIQRMKNWQDFNFRPLDMLKTEAAVCASMNCMLIAGDLIKPKEIQPDIESMKMIKKMYDFGESIYNKVKDIPSYADVAIISSPEQVRTNQNKAWKVDYSRIEACYHAVINAGLTAHILYDDDLEENLSKYQFAIIPEQAYMGRDAVKVIDKYVENGGKILVTGYVPQSIDEYEVDEKGDKAPFEKILGVKYNSVMDEPISYMDIKDTEAMKYWNFEGVTPAIAIGGSPELVTLDTAVMETPLYAPAMTYQVGARPKGEVTEYPAISSNKYGKGTAIFMAQPVYSEMFKNGTFGATRLIHGIIKAMVKPYAKLTGNPSAQAVIAKTDDTICASVINFHNDLNNLGPRVADDVASIYGMKITLQDDRIPVSAEAVLGDDVNVIARNGIIDIEFPPTKIYSGVVLKFK